MFVIGRKQSYFIGVMRIDLWQTRMHIDHTSG